MDQIACEIKLKAEGLKQKAKGPALKAFRLSAKHE
jgi:hypothetical protein